MSEQIKPGARLALSALLLLWLALSLTSLVEHLVIGGMPPGGASVSAFGAGTFFGVIGVLLSVFWVPLYGPLHRFITHRPTLWFRLFVGLLLTLFLEAIWTIITAYVFFPKMPLGAPSIRWALLGFIPCGLLSAAILWLFRAVKPQKFLLIAAGYTFLPLLLLYWIPPIRDVLSCFIVAGAVVFTEGIWCLVFVSLYQIPKRFLLAESILLGLFFIWFCVSYQGSYQWRDEASRAGRLARLAAHAARPLLLTEEDGLKGLMRIPPAAIEELGPFGLDDAKEIDDALTASKPQAVVFMVFDAVRADFAGASTPNFDRLKREGVSFENYRSTSAGTIEAMRALFKSAYPGAYQKTGPNLFERTKAAGYKTIMVLAAKYVFLRGNEWLREGVDVINQASKYRDAAQISAELVSELKRSWSQDPSQRIFLWAYYNDAHSPYDGAGDSPKEKYKSEVEYIDQELGKLLTALEAEGFLEKTMLVLTADHGEEFGEHFGAYHNLTLFDEILRVPLLIRAPNASIKGVVKRPTNAIDLGYTLAEIMGAQERGSLKKEDSPTMFSRGLLRRPVNEPSFAVRGFVPDSFYFLGEIAILWGRYKLVYGLSFSCAALYDLQDDPNETNNLIESKPAIASLLASELEKILAQGVIGSRRDQ